MEVLNTIFALAAAIFSGIAIFLTRKYHRISMMHAKSESLQRFINTSWALLSAFEIIKDTLIKSKAVSAEYIMDEELEKTINTYMKEMRIFAKSIVFSGLFTDQTQKYTSQIYSLFASVKSEPINLSDLQTKIQELQKCYDNGLATK